MINTGDFPPVEPNTAIQDNIPDGMDSCESTDLSSITAETRRHEDEAPPENSASPRLRGDTKYESAQADDTSVTGGAEEQPYVKPPKPAPTFTCAQSGEKLDKDRVLRFVIGPENTLYPDFAEKLPGKEFFVNLYRPTMEAALESNPFGADIVIPADMMDQIENGLRHQALSMLSMTKKAGQLLTGAEKTEGMLKSGKASVYLTASPKDADTRMTLTFHAQANNARIVDFFTSDELSKASGANKVYHAALGRGGTATKFFVHVKRMNLFRDQTLNQED